MKHRPGGAARTITDDRKHWIFTEEEVKEYRERMARYDLEDWEPPDPTPPPPPTAGARAPARAF